MRFSYMSNGVRYLGAALFPLATVRNDPMAGGKGMIAVIEGNSVSCAVIPKLVDFRFVKIMQAVAASASCLTRTAMVIGSESTLIVGSWRRHVLMRFEVDGPRSFSPPSIINWSMK